MAQHFHHIILMGRAGVSGVPETLLSVHEFLSRRDLQISVEEQTAALIPQLTLPIVIPQQLPSDSDLIIVVGGDGSLLSAAHIAAQHDIPVLGINRGRLGFLTDIRPDEIEKIGDVLEGNYQQEFRFLLEADLRYLDDQIEHQIALNDVVLLPGDLAQMIEFEIRINNHFVYKQRADGLIVATPTGSTAYALSGGGPILHPHLEAMVLVPMFPHTLTSRPFVADAQSQIELIITPNNETSPYVSSDGHGRCPIPPGGKVCIRKYKKRLHLIHPTDYNYYRTLREKLGWHQHSKEWPFIDDNDP